MNTLLSPTATHLADASRDSGTPEWLATVGLVLLVILGIGLVVGYLVLFIGSLISVLSSRTLTGGGKLLWVVAIFVFQLLGPLAWFLWGRNAQLSRPPHDSAR